MTSSKGNHILIFISDNVLPFNFEKRLVWDGTLESLNQAAKDKFNSCSEITSIYKDNGMKVISLDEINYKDKIILCFHNESLRSERKNKSRINYVEYASKDIHDPIALINYNDDNISKISSISKATPKEKYNYYVAMNKNSYCEVNKMAKYSVFCSLSAKERALLNDSSKIFDEIQRKQYDMFYQQLIENHICNSHGDYYFYKEICSKTNNLLSTFEFDNVGIIISGKKASGKSLLLNNMASIYYNKLVAAKLTSDVLMIPYNFELNILTKDNLRETYNQIIYTTFQSLKYTALHLWPIMDTLYNFYKSLPHFGTGKRFPTLNGVKNVDIKGLESLAKDITAIFHVRIKEVGKINKSKNDSLFLDVMELPKKMAQCFGIGTVCYIFDHVDLCGSEIQSCLNRLLSNCPYLIATKCDMPDYENPPDIENQYVLFTSEFLDIESTFELKIKSVTTTSPQTKSSVNKKLDISITLNDFDGCPGYMSLFIDTCLKLKNIRISGNTKNIESLGMVSSIVYSKMLILCLVDLLILNGNKFDNNLRDHFCNCQAVYTDVVIDEKLLKEECEEELLQENMKSDISNEQQIDKEGENINQSKDEDKLPSNKSPTNEYPNDDSINNMKIRYGSETYIGNKDNRSYDNSNDSDSSDGWLHPYSNVIIRGDSECRPYKSLRNIELDRSDHSTVNQNKSKVFSTSYNNIQLEDDRTKHITKLKTEVLLHHEYNKLSSEQNISCASEESHKSIDKNYLSYFSDTKSNNQSKANKNRNRKKYQNKNNMYWFNNLT